MSLIRAVSGNINVLYRDDSPDLREMDVLGISKTEERNSRSILFALPFTGGAATLMDSVPSDSFFIVFDLAPGFTFIRKITELRLVFCEYNIRY